MKALQAEFLGTFWLVFGGCGSAVIAAGFPEVGIGLLGVACAFGLTVTTMAYAIGHISGCHLNPAVTLGLVAGGRFSFPMAIPYLLAQILGGLAGAFVLYAIASGKPGFEIGGFASNGYGSHSPGGYNLMSCAIAEGVLTYFFLMIILGSTDKRSSAGFAGLAIGLALSLIHLVGIPVTNLSVNPARSLGPAVVLQVIGGQSWALEQVWLFFAAPIAGAILAGLTYRTLLEESPVSP